MEGGGEGRGHGGYIPTSMHGMASYRGGGDEYGVTTDGVHEPNHTLPSSTHTYTHTHTTRTHTFLHIAFTPKPPVYIPTSRRATFATSRLRPTHCLHCLSRLLLRPNPPLQPVCFHGEGLPHPRDVAGFPYLLSGPGALWVKRGFPAYAGFRGIQCSLRAIDSVTGRLSVYSTAAPPSGPLARFQDARHDCSRRKHGHRGIQNSHPSGFIFGACGKRGDRVQTNAMPSALLPLLAQPFTPDTIRDTLALPLSLPDPSCRPKGR